MIAGDFGESRPGMRGCARATVGAIAAPARHTMHVESLSQPRDGGRGRIAQRIQDPVTDRLFTGKSAGLPGNWDSFWSVPLVGSSVVSSTCWGAS
jgi:hypothetical protein